MGLPRMTIKRWFITVAVIALVIVLRQLVGDYCRREAFYCAAEANAVMMDGAGFGHEDQDKKDPKVSQQFATAQSQEAYYSKLSRRYKTVAWLLGMSGGPNYVPPEVQVPMPQYGESR